MVIIEVLLVSLTFAGRWTAAQFANTYTIELFLSCDKACHDRLTTLGYTSSHFLYDVTKETDKRMASLNVSVVLVGMEIWNAVDMISVNSSLSAVRTRYGRHRARTQLTRKWSDVSVLVTGRELGGISSDPNGIMPLGGACLGHSGAGILKYTIQNSAGLAATLAHELGHGLRISHDTPECCPTGRYKCIMSPVYDASHVYAPVFSSCSVDDFQAFLSISNSACIKTRETSHYIPANADPCGNGVLDPGENCDCGLGCLQGCCGCCQQCQLVTGAECSRGGCCDIDTCKVRQHGSVCRESGHDSCDPEDVCDGVNSECLDQVAMGDDCVDGYGVIGYCLQGDCQTRNRQCQRHWGNAFHDGDNICYDVAVTYPTWFANCGQNKNGYYLPCSYGDNAHYKCGTLQCTGPDPISSLGQHKSPQVNVFVRNETCISGDYAVWEWIQGSGLLGVQQGTKCADSKACLDGDCVDLEAVIGNMNGTDRESQLSEPNYCGDSVINNDETCDCGPNQCPCCNPVTCQLLGPGVSCLGDECHVCGEAELCTGTPSSEYTSCESGLGLCSNGTCVSRKTACQRIYNDRAQPAPYDIYSKNIFGNSSQHNAGGYMLLNTRTRSWNTVYRQFYPAPDHGVCGILQCSTSGSAVVRGLNNRRFNSRTFHLKEAPGVRIAYYTLETTTRWGEVYDRYYPVLVDFGTPCITNTGLDGYCDTLNLSMDRWDWNWYWYAKCVPINI